MFHSFIILMYYQKIVCWCLWGWRLSKHDLIYSVTQQNCSLLLSLVCDMHIIRFFTLISDIISA